MRRHPSWPPLVIAATLAFTSWCAQAQTADTPVPIRIERQPLAEALNAWARQTRIPLVVQQDLVAGKTAASVAGTLAPRQALDRLLAGSGLVAVQEGSAIVVRAAPAPQARKAVALPPVTVTASAEQETATGPVQGYAARRSATGTKTDTPLIETPQSITVIGAEEIETLKAQSLQDALGYAAGVNRAEGLDRTTDAFYLRGFKTGNASVLRDGSPYVVNYYNGRQEPYGLERIELLKGAASVLYGTSAPGGVVNTVSKRPSATPLRELNVELGSFGRKQISGDFGGALGQGRDWSYRLTVLARDSDSFIDHVPDDRIYIAPALRWQPDAATSLTLLAEYQRDRTVYVDGLPPEGTVLPNANGRIPRSRFTGEPGYDKFVLERHSVGYLFEHTFGEQWKLRHGARTYHARNEYNYTWGWSLSEDQRSTLYRGAQDRWDRSSAVTSDTSLQYQARHGVVQHTVLAGVDYSGSRHASERYNRDAANLDYYAPAYGAGFGAPVPADFSWKDDLRRIGLYLQDQMKISERWVLLLGGRRDTVRYDARAFFSGEKTADAEKSHAFTGRAGMVYLADGGLAPFLSYSESFEPTEGFDRQGARFKPTTGRQFEAGVRWQPEGGGTLLSAAVYHLQQDNVTVADPLDTSHSIQAGRVRSRGLELEARTRVDRNLQIIAAYAYTDARTVRASPLQPEEVGKRTAGTPYHQLALWADYGLGAFGLPGLRFGGGVRHVGSTRGLAQGTPVAVPAFTLIDAMLSYSSGPWKYALNITNLADRTYVASCTYGCFYGEPRKAVATATYRW